MKNKIIAVMDCIFNYKPQPKKIKQGRYFRDEDRWIREATKQFNLIRKSKKL